MRSLLSIICMIVFFLSSSALAYDSNQGVTCREASRKICFMAYNMCSQYLEAGATKDEALTTINVLQKVSSMTTRDTYPESYFKYTKRVVNICCEAAYTGNLDDALSKSVINCYLLKNGFFNK